MSSKLNEMPNSLIKHFECMLLHKKSPVYFGKKKDPETEEWIENIRYICKECKGFDEIKKDCDA